MPRFPSAERPARLEELADVCARRQEAKTEACLSDDWTGHAALNLEVRFLAGGLGPLTRQERDALLERIEARRPPRRP